MANGNKWLVLKNAVSGPERTATGDAWLALKNAVCGPKKTASGLNGTRIPIPMWECKLIVAVNVASALGRLGRLTEDDLRHMRSDPDVKPMIMRLSDCGDLRPRAFAKTNRGTI